METKICPQCKTTSQVDVDMCLHCYFPFSGTDKEKAIFIAEQIRKKSKVKDVKNGIKSAQNVLIGIAAYEALSFLIYLTNGGRDPFEIGIELGFILLFGACAFTLKRYPLISIIIPFSILVLFYILILLLIPEDFFQGILWKIIFIIGLIYGLNSVLQSNKLSKESDYLLENNPIAKPDRKTNSNLLDDEL